MKNILKHVETIKAKPHHHRKRIAVGVATAGTALIALLWFVGNLVSGSFAIQSTSFADVATGKTSTQTANTSSANQNLAGVGAAAAVEDTSAPAHIEIVDTHASSSKRQYEQTTIPF